MTEVALEVGAAPVAGVESVAVVEEKTVASLSH